MLGTEINSNERRNASTSNPMIWAKHLMTYYW